MSLNKLKKEQQSKINDFLLKATSGVFSTAAA